MIRKFFVRVWYALACIFTIIFGGCVVLFLALCYGFKGFACYFRGAIKSSIGIFIDSFHRASNSV